MRLYRAVTSYNGDKTQYNPYFLGSRLPRNIDYQLHLIIDKWFYSKFGVHARSKAIFCSPSRKESSKYLVDKGVMLELTIPENEPFTAIYSLSVLDLYSETCHLSSPYDEVEIHEILEKKNYQSTNILSTIPSYFNGEVMLCINKHLTNEV